MKKSLLSQFYTDIKVQHENIVSKGLAYIIESSENVKKTIQNFVKREFGIELPYLSYSIQNFQKENGIPDISGITEDNKERLIFEAKFEADLTEKQPIKYIERLDKNSILIIICPSSRTLYLENRITKKLKNQSINYEEINENVLKIGSKIITIQTWTNIFSIIKTALIQDNNHEGLADLFQIQSLSELIENESFLPISNNELSPKFAKRALSYYGFLDNLIEKLIKEDFIDKKGLNRTGQQWGYVRYCKTKHNPFELGLCLDFEYWAKYENTPFWLTIYIHQRDKNIEISQKFDNKFKNKKKILKTNIYKDRSSKIYFPIFISANKTENELLLDFSKRLIKIIEYFVTELKN